MTTNTFFGTLWAEWRARRAAKAALAQLAALDDRLLSDIGLERDRLCPALLTGPRTDRQARQEYLRLLSADDRLLTDIGIDRADVLALLNAGNDNRIRLAA
ncbi:MAG TPA: DUF1127 domain-containing protein [Alphaproteobacteria bacterium]|nr:DUF1127 domain-containing protein [Alphaproteobacteria bacterium]